MRACIKGSVRDAVVLKLAGNSIAASYVVGRKMIHIGGIRGRSRDQAGTASPAFCMLSNQVPPAENVQRTKKRRGAGQYHGPRELTPSNPRTAAS
jgi:hypothetical protein